MRAALRHGRTSAACHRNRRNGHGGTLRTKRPSIKPGLWEGKSVGSVILAPSAPASAMPSASTSHMSLLWLALIKPKGKGSQNQ